MSQLKFPFYIKVFVNFEAARCVLQKTYSKKLQKIRVRVFILVYQCRSVFTNLFYEEAFLRKQSTANCQLLPIFPKKINHKISQYAGCISLVPMSLGKQKQPPDVFCKSRCSGKLSKFNGKATVLETLFDKAAGLKAFRPATLLKRDSSRVAFL